MYGNAFIDWLLWKLWWKVMKQIGSASISNRCWCALLSWGHSVIWCSFNSKQRDSEILIITNISCCHAFVYKFAFCAWNAPCSLCVFQCLVFCIVTCILQVRWTGCLCKIGSNCKMKMYVKEFRKSPMKYTEGSQSQVGTWDVRPFAADGPSWRWLSRLLSRSWKCGLYLQCKFHVMAMSDYWFIAGDEIGKSFPVNCDPAIN